MLGAGPEPAEEQRRHEQAEAGAGAGQAIADAGERGAQRQHRRGAEALGNQPGGNLEARHGAGKEPAQQAELGIAKSELLLPDRHHHVDQIGVAVVQRVRAAGDACGSPLLAPHCRRVRIDIARNGHDPYCDPGADVVPARGRLTSADPQATRASSAGSSVSIFASDSIDGLRAAGTVPDYGESRGDAVKAL